MLNWTETFHQFFFVDRKTAMALGTGWKDTALSELFTTKGSLLCSSNLTMGIYIYRNAIGFVPIFASKIVLLCTVFHKTLMPPTVNSNRTTPKISLWCDEATFSRQSIYASRVCNMSKIMVSLQKSTS